jgi:O-antigen/teichoic acid export membrane protein
MKKLQIWVQQGQVLQQKLQQPGSIATLVRGASTALLTQTLSVGVIYLTQVSLARWMGVTEYGIYEYVATIELFLAFLAGLGMSSAVLRFIPEYTVQQDWGHLRGIIWSSWGQTILAGVAIALLGNAIVFTLHHFYPFEPVTALALGLWGVPLLALTKLQLEMVRGIRAIALAYAPSAILYPLMLLAATFTWMQIRGSLTSVEAIGLALICLTLMLAYQFIRFQFKLEPKVHQAKPQFDIRKWLFVSLPLLFIDGSFMVLNQTDTLMIGASLGAKEVGIYSAAMKTAAWVNFILISVNSIAAPLFASLYAQGKRAELQRLVSAIARWMFYPALLVAIGLMVFADPLLALFGPEFAPAKWAMFALIIGQLVNVGAGSVGYLLMMTGHHIPCARVVGCSAILNLLLNLVGIPLLGILGAAIATALSMSLWNIWLNALVVKHLGVNPSIVAALGSRE